MNSITDKIDLSDDEIDAAFSSIGCAIAVGYGDDEKVAVTGETLDQFIQSVRGYAEPGRSSRQTASVNGSKFNALVVLGCQPKKGAQRRDLYVIDFGAVRAAYF